MLDGVGDPEIKYSALKRAKKPNLDMFTRLGRGGLIGNYLDEHPDSGISQFVILGYDIRDYPGRGLFDAFRVIEPREDEIYLRANFSTVEHITPKHSEHKGHVPEKFKVTDRRAGRETLGLENLAKKISKFNIEGVKISVYKSVGHRLMVSLKGKNLSTLVTDSDPGKAEEFVNIVKPKDKSTSAIHTAKVLNKFMLEVHKILRDEKINKRRKYPANFILLRGPGKWRYLKPFKEKHGLKGCIIAGSPVTKGIGKVIGMTVPDIKGATANSKTNLKNKVDAALKALKTHDFVLLHILGTDVLSHDKNFSGKVGFIERVDKEVFKVLDNKLDFSDIVLAVTGDHCTSVRTGMHMAGKFPFCIYTKHSHFHESKKFDEESCKIGPLIPIEEFMEEVISFL